MLTFVGIRDEVNWVLFVSGSICCVEPSLLDLVNAWSLSHKL